MKKETQPPEVEKNFSFSLFKAVERDFEAAIENGCYQKKALLTKLLTIEIERLEAAIGTAVPQEVTRRIREIQNDASLKKMWVSQQVQLPSTLIDRIQEVCKNKGVVRDAWVNRVLFLATGTKLFNALMPLNEFEKFEYFGDNRDNREANVELTAQRLTGPLDPLCRLHDAIVEPGEEEPQDLYKIRLFSKWHPKGPMPSVYDAQVSEKGKGLRTEWMLHKFAWCITCWAEIEDLPELEEPDWHDIL